MKHYAGVFYAVIALVLIFPSHAAFAQDYDWSCDTGVDNSIPQVKTGCKRKGGSPADGNAGGGGDYAPPPPPVVNSLLPSGRDYFMRYAQNNSSLAGTTCQAGTELPKTDKVGKFPVVYSTGEKVKSETDFLTSTQFDMSLVRTYRSMHKWGILFGPNWISSLDHPNLVFSNYYGVNRSVGSLTLTDSTGAEHVFTNFRESNGHLELPEIRPLE